MKRETKVSLFRNHFMTFDWDDLVEELNGGAIEYATDELAGEIYWAIALPHMKEPQEVKERFWQGFIDPPALERREKALYGVRATNMSAAINILRLARSCDDREPKSRQQGLTILGANLEALVKDGEYKTIKDMASIIEDGGIEGTRGNKDEAPAQLLRAFCLCHLDELKLPTRKQIRERSGLHLTKSESDLNKALKKLGLGGLPSS